MACTVRGEMAARNVTRGAASRGSGGRAQERLLAGQRHRGNVFIRGNVRLQLLLQSLQTGLLQYAACNGPVICFINHVNHRESPWHVTARFARDARSSEQ